MAGTIVYILVNHATKRQSINHPFKYTNTIPKDENPGAMEIRDPRKSALAISVI